MDADSRRLEELSLNSSAPPGQLLYDGWVLRLCAGKAKRARSVNAVYSSTRPLDEKIAYCEALYATCGLPAIFRLTPFSQPPELDAALELRGYGRFDPTAVESASLDPAPIAEGSAQELSLAAWVEAVGDLRGSPPMHRAGHLRRLEGTPLQKNALAIEEGGRIVATGLTIIEDRHAGLFDIVTHADRRRQGHARRILQSLLARAWGLGARHAYLQVEQGNAPARRLYAQFGFVERYLYWYRGRAGEQQ